MPKWNPATDRRSDGEPTVGACNANGEIRNLLNEYASALDVRDTDRLVAVVTEDAQFSY